MMNRRAAALLAYLVVAAAPLLAQPTRVRLPAGVRVRVSAPPRPGWVVGTVALADSERIVLRSASDMPPDTVPLAAVQALEVSTGRPRLGRTFGGILLGAVIGGAVGAAFDVAVDLGAEVDAPPGAVGGILGAVGGALIGGAVGAATAPERWRRVPVR
jgi:hypothetical protein